MLEAFLKSRAITALIAREGALPLRVGLGLGVVRRLCLAGSRVSGDRLPDRPAHELGPGKSRAQEQVPRTTVRDLTGYRFPHAQMLAGLIALLAVALPAPASADGALAKLRDAPCPAEPVYFQHEPAYGRERLAAAREDRFKVYQRLGPDRLVPPIDWNADPYGNEDWRSTLHSLGWLDVLFHIDATPIERLQPVARDLADPDPGHAALAAARDVVLDWVEQNPRGGRGVDPRAWGNKVAAERAGYIAYALRAGTCAGILDRAAARMMLDSLADHARFLAAEQVPGNHGLFVDYGLAVIARQAPFIPRAGAIGRFALGRFAQLLHQRLDRGDGLWLEHSPTYQFLVLRLVGKMARVTGDHGLRRASRSMQEAAPWLLNPEGRLLQLGDSYASRVNPAIRARGARVDGARAFFDSGYAAVRHPRRGDLFALVAGYFNRWHKHGDDLSFELFSRGTHVVADTGRIGKLVREDFARSAPAHSTLTVDGVDFADQLLPFYGSALDAAGRGGGWRAFLARNPRVLSQGVRHWRLFLYRPGVALVVVDHLDADEPHVYRRFVQLGPTISAVRRDHGFDLTSADGFAGRLSDTTSSAPAKLALVKGRLDPPGGLLFPGFSRSLPRFTIGLRSEAEDAVYALAIALDGTGGTSVRLPAGSHGDLVVVNSPGRAPERIAVTRDGRDLTVAVSGANRGHKGSGSER